MIKATNKDLYEELIEEKEKGKIYGKEDLTYDILYQLSVVENVPDSLIGYIFDMNKTQIRYLRRKNNLENVFLKRIISRPEVLKPYFEKNNIDNHLLSQELIYNGLKLFARSKGWNPELVDKYIEEEYKKTNKKLSDETNDKKNEYTVEITDSTIISKQTTSKKIAGRNCNQIKNAISRIKAGELGEEIVYAAEKRKLENLGLSHLAAKVKRVTKTTKKNITFDGAGCDIISYNEHGEKIFIEVKCSTTNKKNIIFFITTKEVELMNGNLDGIKKEYAFIYYVYDIDRKNNKAKIEIIDYKKFQQLTLNPITYKISVKLTPSNVSNKLL